MCKEPEIKIACKFSIIHNHYSISNLFFQIFFAALFISSLVFSISSKLNAFFPKIQAKIEEINPKHTNFFRNFYPATPSNRFIWILDEEFFQPKI